MNSHFNKIREEVEEELKRAFDSRNDIPQKLLDSMRYSLFAGGKRLRPMLVVAAVEAVGGTRSAALPTAAAFEMIHTYTLIHDDLPAMDDDDLRRGLPTNHKKFGEATAVLAGDALLTLAFEVMAQPLPADCAAGSSAQLRMIANVAHAVGAQGTVGGQEMDIDYEGRNGDLEALEYIHKHKTGTMISSAVESGGILGGASEEEYKALSDYGRSIGLAFQVIDDILDIEGNTEKLGKKSGADEKRKKMTYPSVIGLEKSRKTGNALVQKAIESLKPLGEKSGPLKELALFITERSQ